MDPNILRPFIDVGALGLALTAVWAFATGRVYGAGIVNELRKERDEWRLIATTAVDRVDRLADLFERKP